MSRIRTWIASGLTRQSVEHAARTTVAATVSLLAARAMGLREAYWAPITTLVVVQSTLGAARTVSLQRLIGTALGAALGALSATYFGSNLAAFSAGILLLGLICAALHIDRGAYRFAGITLAIVMLIIRAQAPWVIALHRSIEVSLGVVVGLVLTAIWPEHQSAPVGSNATGSAEPGAV
ncbi:MAG: FUSC family protein [Bryobacteraceae bacterium]